MKIIVAGGRDFSDYALLASVLDAHVTPGVDTIVSGGARGADSLGERYAARWHIRCTIFRADWDQLGKKAGYLRNEHMAVNSDSLIAFWDGESKGTKHMIDIALREGLEVHVYPY